MATNINNINISSSKQQKAIKSEAHIRRNGKRFSSFQIFDERAYLTTTTADNSSESYYDAYNKRRAN